MNCGDVIDKVKELEFLEVVKCGKVNIGGNLVENKSCLVKFVMQIAVCLQPDKSFESFLGMTGVQSHSLPRGMREGRGTPRQGETYGRFYACKGRVESFSASC